VSILPLSIAAFQLAQVIERFIERTDGGTRHSATGIAFM
jgi:hypothetical protein